MARSQKQVALRAPRVFLSYAKEDQNRVRTIYRKLAAENLNAWLDLADLLPGQDWDKAIIAAIRNARLVLLFLSKNSISKRGYVQKEIKEALDAADKLPEGEVFIIPVRLEDCPVRDRLAKLQWIDVFRPHGFQRIVSTMRLHLGQAGNLSNSRNMIVAKDTVLDLLLANKFRKRGQFGFARLSSNQIAISDGVFLEFREKLPKVLRELRREVRGRIRVTPTTVAAAIPSTRIYRKNKNLLKQILFDKEPWLYVLVSDGGTRTYVDKEYLNFILESIVVLGSI